MTLLLELLLLLVCLAPGLHFRLEMLDAAFMGSDSVGPYAKAYQILSGRNFFPLGPFPESGYLAPYSFVPYLIFSGSLRGAIAIRFCWNAFLILALYFGLRRARPAGLVWATPMYLIGVAFLELSPGLADTLLTGYQTFDVPAYATLTTVGVLLFFFSKRGEESSVNARAAYLFIPTLPFLAMLHPMAIIYAVACLIPVYLLFKNNKLRALGVSCGIAALLALPQLYRFANAGRWRWSGILEHMAGVAHSPGQFDGLAAVLRKVVLEELVIRDLYPHVLLLASPFLTLVLFPLFRWRLGREEKDWLDGLFRFTLWTSSLPLALIVIAWSVHYLQPYHLRILFPALAAQMALLLAALALCLRPCSRGVAEGRKQACSNRSSEGQTQMRSSPRLSDFIPPLLLCLCLASMITVMWKNRFPPPEINRSTLAIHEEISAVIQADRAAEPQILEFLHLTNDLSGYPPAVVLDELLHGTPEGAFLSSPEQATRATFYLALTGAVETLRTVILNTDGLQGCSALYMAPSEDLLLVKVEGLAALRLWSKRLCSLLPEDGVVRVGGANDYLGWFNPEHDTTLEKRWFSQCLWDR